MPTAYDEYTELARIRAATQGVQAAQWIQTGLSAQMSSCLGGIQHEMNDLRATSEKSLAVQQALLREETIQRRLEEFIFQTQKLVAELQKTELGLPPSSQYFLLKGILETVDRERIATPIIRGRDNKAAFDDALQKAKALTVKLEDDPDVKAALEWAAAEQRRKLEAAEALTQRQREMQSMLAPFLEQMKQLQAKRVTLTFGKWHGSQFRQLVEALRPVSSAVERFEPKFFRSGSTLTAINDKVRPYFAPVVITIALWWVGLGFIWIPMWYRLVREKDERKLNAQVDYEINILKAQVENIKTRAL